MLDIVFGENAGTIPAQSLQAELQNLDVSGTLYLGYPVLSTADGKVFVDALLVSETHGLVAFDLSSRIEGARPSEEEKAEIADRQNQIYASIYNKLNTYASLRRGRSLAVVVGVITYHTGLAEPIEDGDLVATPPAGLPKVIERFGEVPPDVLRALNAAVQRVSTLRPPNKREHVVRADSRGAILKRIEREIANLDNWQNKGAIEYANGPYPRSRRIGKNRRSGVESSLSSCAAPRVAHRRDLLVSRALPAVSRPHQAFHVRPDRG
ncbi:hypothetical protein [Phenylobacterium sp.]|uniref:hypothetical protein n=1 Tax=Phenylobacterium sp. TaxID=1871053 RepID=UPI0026006E6E|nr:hypothetical protein [Phenylobacterium sp.]